MMILKIIISFFKTIGQLSMKFFRLHKKIYSLSNLLHIDNFMSLGLIFLLMWSLSNINFEVLNPVGEAFGDVALTDVMYSKLDKNSEYRDTDEYGLPIADTNIFIVNCGHLNRAKLSKLVRLLKLVEPKVLGIDIKFTSDLDPSSDLVMSNERAAMYPSDSLKIIDSLIRANSSQQLASAFFEYDNLVFASQGTDYILEDNSYSTISRCSPAVNLGGNGTSALANVVTDQYGDQVSQFNVCRKFLAGADIKSDTSYEEHFTVAILKMYDSTAYKTFKERNNREEYINYVGNITVPYQDRPFPKFRAFDHEELLNPTFFQDPDNVAAFEKMKGKIVLLGYLGHTINDPDGEDKFFTPLNKRYVGKTDKDMYGVVVHANTLAMMLEGNYITVMPKWLGETVGLVVTFLVFASYRPIYNDYKNWYDGLTKIMGIFLTMVILFIIGIVFDKFDYEIEFSAFYFGCILLAGDFLEVYYGFVKTFASRIKNNL